MKSFLVVVLTLVSMSVFAMKNIVLKEGNFSVLDGPITPQSVSQVMYEVQQKDAVLEKGEPIYLIMITEGGSVEYGQALINFFKALDRKIHTITIESDSMGFFIVQSLGNRYIFPTGRLMAHRISGSLEGPFGNGESFMETRYKDKLKIAEYYDKLVVKRTKGKQTLKSYRKAYNNELWVRGEDAIKQGYADEVVLVSCDKSLLGYKTKVLRNMYGQAVQSLSKCPLIPGEIVPLPDPPVPQPVVEAPVESVEKKEEKPTEQKEEKPAEQKTETPEEQKQEVKVGEEPSSVKDKQ